MPLFSKHLLTLSVLVPLGACGKKEAPPDKPADKADVAVVAAKDAASAVDTTPAPDEPPADCVDAETAKVMGTLDPDLARLHEGAVELCGEVEGGARKCVSLDLASGKRRVVDVGDTDFARIPSYPEGFDDGLVKDDKKPIVKLCASAEVGCKDLHTGDVLAAHFDGTRARAVLTAWDEGVRRAKIYDTKSLELVSTIEIGPGELPNCTFSNFVGENLLISTGECDGAGKSWLADPKTGNKLADIGGEDPIFVKSSQFAKIDDSRRVFRSADGSRAVIQDVKSGEVKAKIDLTVRGDAAPKHGGAWVLASQGQAIFVEGAPTLGSVFVAEADGKVSKQLVPRPCAP
jgi:hypothetical protein